MVEASERRQRGQAAQARILTRLALSSVWPDKILHTKTHLGSSLARRQAQRCACSCLHASAAEEHGIEPSERGWRQQAAKARVLTWGTLRRLRKRLRKGAPGLCPWLKVSRTGLRLGSQLGGCLACSSCIQLCGTSSVSSLQLTCVLLNVCVAEGLWLVHRSGNLAHELSCLARSCRTEVRVAPQEWLQAGMSGCSQREAGEVTPSASSPWTSLSWA